MAWNVAFEALAMGEEQLVKTMDLSCFNWCSVHSKFGTPLHAVLFGKICCQGDAADEDEECSEEHDEDDHKYSDGYFDIVDACGDEVEARLNLLQFAIQRGANPHLPAPVECDAVRYWGDEGKMRSITFAGKSAFESLLAMKRSLKASDCDRADGEPPIWKEELQTVDRALDIMASATSEAVVRVPEAVAETWEKILEDSVSADVTICVEESGREDHKAGEVKAHSLVLSQASPVLHAMLATQAMREGASKVISVQGCGCESVRLVLGLMYAGSMPEEDPSVVSTLLAVDLAHRWQLLRLAGLLATTAGRRIDADNFELAAETALRLDLSGLLTACRTYAADNARAMRARLAKRSPTESFRSVAVRGLVEAVVCTTSGSAAMGSAMSPWREGPPPKRRRAIV